MKGQLIGGPYDGRPAEGEGRNANHQDLLLLKDGQGQEIVYVRDKTEYPDGIVRWRYVNTAVQAPAQHPRANEQVPAVSARMNEAGTHWELLANGVAVNRIARSELRTVAELHQWVTENAPKGTKLSAPEAREGRK